MLTRQLLLAAARSPAARRAVVAAPLGRSLVRRFIAGEDREDVLRVVDRLIVRGLHVSVDHLGEDTVDRFERALGAEHPHTRRAADHLAALSR